MPPRAPCYTILQLEVRPSPSKNPWKVAAGRELHSILALGTSESGDSARTTAKVRQGLVRRVKPWFLQPEASRVGSTTRLLSFQKVLVNLGLTKVERMPTQI